MEHSLPEAIFCHLRTYDIPVFTVQIRFIKIILFLILNYFAISEDIIQGLFSLIMNIHHY
jgi:hypothetical protein